MSIVSPLTGEASDSKVAAILGNEARAREVAGTLLQDLDLQPGQVRVLTPQDRHPGRKLEPESHGIFRTLVVAHYKLAIVGLVFGVLAWALLFGLGIPAVANSPDIAAAVIVSFCTVLGSMLGGLVVLRPDHAPYVRKVQAALRDGKCAVVVHALDAQQRDLAEHALADAGLQTVKTL